MYYRKKEGKIVIEEKVKGKTKFLWTLPPPEVLLHIILDEASSDTKAEVSLLPKKEESLRRFLGRPENREEDPIDDLEKCAQQLLNEPDPKTLSKTDQEFLWEMSK